MNVSKERKRGRRSSRRALVLILTLGLLAVGAGLAATDRASREERTLDSERILSVQTRAAVLEASYTVERSFVGQVEAARESQLGFELAGLLTRVRVEEGDRVARGERLAVLDTARLRSRRDELRAARRRALAELELARSTEERVSEAAHLNAVSTQERDEARRGLEAREAAVEQLDAQIRSLEVEIGKSTLTAPFAGVVAARLADDGEVLAAGRPVLRLLESERLEARIGVPAEAASELTEGGELAVDIRGRTFTGRIKAILPQREARTRTVTVLLELADAATHARSGDLAEIAIARSAPGPGFWLPASALTGSVRGLWSCYVAMPQDGEVSLHRTERRTVEVLHAETDRVFVRGALEPGERVVADGVHRLVPGQLVRSTGEEGAS